MIKKKGASLLWLFPYEVRRAIYKMLFPRQFYNLQKIRNLQTSRYSSLKGFDQKKCIFVHIPKCAGTWIAKNLFGNLGASHLSIPEYQLAFSKKEFDSYFKFAFVRNPWDRLVSAYYFLKSGGKSSKDRSWALKNLDRIGFQDFILNIERQKKKLSYLHFIHQYKFLCEPGKSHPLVDYLGFYERLEEDYSFIAKKLKIDREPLEVLNVTRGRKKDYREYYSEETKRIVFQIYQKDIELFGYDFDNRTITSK